MKRTPDEYEAYIRLLRPSLWLTEHARFILRRLDEARAQSGWRPIETAPEAQMILLASDQGGVYMACWRKEPDQWCKAGHTMPYLPANWTHWMPLPAPPAE
jgi:hypothetical protein